MANRDPKKPAPAPSEPGAAQPASHGRRVGKVVHDDLGNAQVEWVDIPDDRTELFDRPTLAIEDMQTETTRKGVNPYQQATGGRAPPPARRTKRDLKALGEWIKLTRSMQNRKKDPSDQD